MKIKISETTNTQLDWMVAKCEGVTIYMKWIHTSPPPQFSSDWAQGGPIIEREKIATKFFESEASWVADVKGGFFEQYGPTPLLAAMRCYVTSKLGEEVEVPDELGEQS